MLLLNFKSTTLDVHYFTPSIYKQQTTKDNFKALENISLKIGK